MSQAGRYNPQEIETKWQARWRDGCAFRTPALSDKPKFYILDMFPYPSGHGLHVGHLKGYIASDVVARYKRMRGFNVLHPMGWDSFGLPTERQAEKDGLPPQEVTARNIETFKRQLDLVGLCYDWEREFATSDVSYYRWTQWIFNLLFERGLAYQSEVPVNWCPALRTVVANEEVQDGVYIDTGDPVERRNMRQWLLRITAYADRLVRDLDRLDWNENVKDLQRNWIGRSEGAVVRFQVKGSGQTFDVFSSRPETLFGCTFCVLAPEHPLVLQATTPEQKASVEAYRVRCGTHSERDRLSGVLEKTGAFTGAFAQNPLTGADVPIWIADYVLPSYGTGAIFACPAHDQRDFDFAQVHGLDLVQVVAGPTQATELPYPGEGRLFNSGFLDGLDTGAAKRKVTAHLAEIGAGGPRIHYNLRDWLFSRQRYWGEPIPILFQDGQPESDPRLPVILPDLAQLAAPSADDAAAAPLARARDWARTTSPNTGAPVLRETNVMPQWAGSCWYYLRFIDPRNDQAPFDPKLEAAWMPVDLYLGGTEHATLHLLYARFWHKVLYDAGLVSGEEPFQRLFNQGKVQARSFRDETGRYYYPHEVVEKAGQWFSQDGKGPLLTRFEKMSKSRYNVASPDEVVAEHGADSLRLYEMFMGPVDQDNLWQSDGLCGTRRFLERVWRLAGESLAAPADADEESTTMALNRLIKNVTADLEHLHLNTAVSHMMSFLNETTQQRRLSRDALDAFVRVLAPFAPHLAEDLWERLGRPSFVLDAPWPEHDAAKLLQNNATVVVQVNGRRRCQLLIPRGASEATVLLEAMRQPPVLAAAKGNQPSRVIYRPDQIINLVFS